MADAEGRSDPATGDRPVDCQCLPGVQPPCWNCYRAGFRTPNPDAQREA